MKCNHCGHVVYGETRVCPMCGGEMAPDIPPGTPKCPRCDCKLEIHSYRDFELDKCPECQGLWLDFHEFKLLTSERDVYRDDDVDPNFVRTSNPGVEGYLRCARCGRLMNRKNFAGISGIMIDICGDCGCWLDAGELKHIRSFIAAGGLEEAQDKQLARHASELRSLDTRVSDVEFMQRLLHKWEGKRWVFQGF